MIDTHTHVDTRPYEDFEAMAVAGITDVFTLAHDPMRMSSSVVFSDHFEKLYSERGRVEKNGIRLHVCLGMHPRTMPSDPEVCLELLESYLKGKKDREVRAIGEIGLETIDKREMEIFKRQLEVAEKYRMPAIVHTPRSSKGLITREILSILSTISAKKSPVVIDHASFETVKLIIDNGYNAGLTVQPSKLTPSDAADIISENDADLLLLNTDSSSAPTDVLGVPRTVHLMRMKGFDEETIKKVSESNARRIFGI
ncbi:metal-dependent hydrolase [Methanocella sp. CWC-04]|uniref:Metal-dependent hydrolase n=1 Tax=Methanooceanicella nereidis TaxID=2052831 RepID=A0AAP2W5C7_9EURY|nr:TatD family hydrolase [Methanocella sp. CWC-04]MCD1294042.1 metal-dependent hydrolase [Methanocella sp. CWC-04]